MKKSYLLLIFLLLACEEDTTFQTQIFLKNETAYNLKISLYPNSDYKKSDMYKFSDLGSGYNTSTFYMIGNSEHAIFTSGNKDIKPYDLVKKIFDSISIQILSNDSILLKFSPDKSCNYQENLFSSESIWKFEKTKSNKETMFKNNPIESNDFFFSIMDDKIKTH